LCLHVCDAADRPPVEKPLDLAEGRDESVVIAHLGDDARRVGEGGELCRLGGREGQRLLAEDAHPAREATAHEGRVKARGGRDDDGVDLDRIQRGVEIGEGAHPGVLAQHVEDVAGRVDDGLHRHLRVRADHREVREAHLAEPDHGDTDHVRAPICAARAMTSRSSCSYCPATCAHVNSSSWRARAAAASRARSVASARSASIAVVASGMSRKYRPASPATQRLYGLSWATTGLPAARASTSAGFVPPTVCPCRYPMPWKRSAASAAGSP